MYRNGERMMAWIAKVDKVTKHPGADSLDICTIGGWQCVTKLGEFKEDDLAVYISIDSWIPHDLAPFLSKGQEPREYNGVKGERLRTIRLRGTLSQGLLMPLEKHMSGTLLPTTRVVVQEGDDVTEALGIQKYEAPIPAQLAGQVKGMFPSLIPKTDQERIQNMDISDTNGNWQVTEKLEGSSMTVYFIGGEFGVCSRNLDLKRDPNNTLWATAIKYKLERILSTIAAKTGQSLAIQGELVGPGIQGNIYGLKEHKFFVYYVFDIGLQEYWTPSATAAFCYSVGLKHVPIIEHVLSTSNTLDWFLAYAEGKSVLADVEREGVVFKRLEGQESSFKVISNKYLIGEK